MTRHNNLLFFFFLPAIYTYCDTTMHHARLGLNVGGCPPSIVELPEHGCEWVWHKHVWPQKTSFFAHAFAITSMDLCGSLRAPVALEVLGVGAIYIYTGCALLYFFVKVLFDATAKELSHVEELGGNSDAIFETDPSPDFKKLLLNTHCLFAKKATVWQGKYSWNNAAGTKGNIETNMSLFERFVKSKSVDAFVFQIPDQYSQNLSMFACTVNIALRTINKHDPSPFNCLDVNFIEKNGWIFSYDSEPLFITTFAHFYPKSHSRHCEKGAFILFQPESSFLAKKLPPDHGPRKESDHDKLTIRDKIRMNFATHLCPYYVPPTAQYPGAHHIVKPIKDIAEAYQGRGNGIIKWWTSF